MEICFFSFNRFSFLLWEIIEQSGRFFNSSNVKKMFDNVKKCTTILSVFMGWKVFKVYCFATHLQTSKINFSFLDRQTKRPFFIACTSLKLYRMVFWIQSKHLSNQSQLKLYRLSVRIQSRLVGHLIENAWQHSNCTWKSRGFFCLERANLPCHERRRTDSIKTVVLQIEKHFGLVKWFKNNYSRIHSLVNL